MRSRAAQRHSRAQSSAGRRLRLGLGRRDRAADHQFGELAAGRPCDIALSHEPAAAQHRDAAAGGQDLAELVRNEDDRQAALAKSA